MTCVVSGTGLWWVLRLFLFPFSEPSWHSLWLWSRAAFYRQTLSSSFICNVIEFGAHFNPPHSSGASSTQITIENIFLLEHFKILCSRHSDGYIMHIYLVLTLCSCIFFSGQAREIPLSRRLRLWDIGLSTTQAPHISVLARNHIWVDFYVRLSNKEWLWMGGWEDREKQTPEEGPASLLGFVVGGCLTKTFR